MSADVDMPRVDVVIGDLSAERLAAAKNRGSAAIDTETSGLDPTRDVLRTVQVAVPGLGVEIVRIGGAAAPNLTSLLEDDHIVKIFHFAMFDLAFLHATFAAQPRTIRCTKIAAKLLHPGQESEQKLASLVQSRLGVRLDKSAQLSDWSQQTLTAEQLRYAANDVLYLHDLHEVLIKDLANSHLLRLAEACWEHLPIRVDLEARGFGDVFTY